MATISLSSGIEVALSPESRVKVVEGGALLVRHEDGSRTVYGPNAWAEVYEGPEEEVLPDMGGDF